MIYSLYFLSLSLSLSLSLANLTFPICDIPGIFKLHLAKATFTEHPSVREGRRKGEWGGGGGEGDSGADLNLKKNSRNGPVL